MVSTSRRFVSRLPGSASGVLPMPVGRKASSVQHLQGKGHLNNVWRAWAKDEKLREHVLATGSLFSWPSPKENGILNFDTMEYNVGVLKPVAATWCSQHSSPKTIYIPHAREQAWPVLTSITCQTSVLGMLTVCF